MKTCLEHSGGKEALARLAKKIGKFANYYGGNVMPCTGCLLDSLRDTPLYSNWIMLLVGGLFFIGAALALFSAWRRGHLSLKEMEDIKYKPLEE